MTKSWERSSSIETVLLHSWKIITKKIKDFCVPAKNRARLQRAKERKLWLWPPSVRQVVIEPGWKSNFIDQSNHARNSVRVSFQDFNQSKTIINLTANRLPQIQITCFTRAQFEFFYFVRINVSTVVPPNRTPITGHPKLPNSNTHTVNTCNSHFQLNIIIN